MLKIRRTYKIYGIVQGIGFRPFVKRTADRFQIAGDVCNKGSYVEIHAEGTMERIRQFRRSILTDAPKVSHIIRFEEQTEIPRGERGFRIVQSVAESGEMFVSPDLAVCPECRRELFDPSNRRYLHPFINCTNCGPRLTILDSMPYDRVRTTMKKFPMCGKCEYEYTHPETRRYHAQPVCCNEDGPQLRLIETAGRQERSRDTAGKNEGLTGRDAAAAVTQDGRAAEQQIKRDERIRNRDQALIRAREIIRNGGILAVKGIGGFHLSCDASNEDAVRRLRRLKNRPMKPFAVMMRDLETVKRECEILPGETEILDGVEKPILILKKRKYGERTDISGRKGALSEGSGYSGGAADAEPLLAASAAPDNPTAGVMLPYAPVQLLLFDYPDGYEMTDMLVMTSGNPSGAPICRTTEEAVRYLSPMCDAILTNDREILTRADDSVMQFEEGKPYMIRRSRGYAPLPLFCRKEREGQVLAVGGELKNTFVLAKNELYYPSAYIGDLADLRSVRALSDTIPRMERLLEIRPELIACDLHPGYQSTAFAKRFAKEQGLPLLFVQHHYAHILSCMAEHDEEGAVIGISFDGTGYGTDGTVWGGEFLLASPEGFVRLGSVQPFPEAGGDAAAREGWRIAVALLYQMYAEELLSENDASGTADRFRHDADFNSGTENRRNKSRSFAQEQKDRIREQVRADAEALRLCDEKSLQAELYLLEHRMNCVESTSVGRLFDAVSALLGIRRKSTFEGEASMALEYAAMPETASPVRPDGIWIRERTGGQPDTEISVSCAAESMEEASGSAESAEEEAEEIRQGLKPPVQIDRRQCFREPGCGYSERRFVYRNSAMIRALLEGLKGGRSVSELAGGFHSYLAETVLDGAKRSRELTGVSKVALSGGCFQNVLLLRKCRQLLRENGFEVLTHSLIPPNDGGIALGQARAAMRRL